MTKKNKANNAEPKAPKTKKSSQKSGEEVTVTVPELNIQATATAEVDERPEVAPQAPAPLEEVAEPNTDVASEPDSAPTSSNEIAGFRRQIIPTLFGHDLFDVARFLHMQGMSPEAISKIAKRFFPGKSYASLKQITGCLIRKGKTVSLSPDQVEALQSSPMCLHCGVYREQPDGTVEDGTACDNPEGHKWS